MMAYAFEHRMEHVGSEAAGLSIITTAMIAIEQGQAIGQPMFSGMAKLVIALLQTQGHQHGLMRDQS